MKAAETEAAQLNAAIEAYERGFMIDPSHYYPGINAVTLWALKCHVTRESRPEKFTQMMSSVRWCTDAMSQRNVSGGAADYWALAARAELLTVEGDAEFAQKAWARAAMAGKDSWFDLDSSKQQLQIFTELDFNTQAAREGLLQLQRKLDKFELPLKPRHAILFSGHMIDAPGRKAARFPESKVPAIDQAIRQKLDEYGVNENDLAVCSGACGGDLLFAHAALDRGARLALYLPLPEPQFLEKSVRFAGERWIKSFDAAKQKAARTLIAPTELGPPPPGSHRDYPFERVNMWMLYTALSCGAERLRFLALWDGKGGDGPGGTAHLVREVSKYDGQYQVISPFV
jgi:hypothetical protein